MYLLANNLQTYHEVFVPGKTNPLMLLRNAIAAGIFEDYMMYEREQEVRIVANPLADVAVGTDTIYSNYLGDTYSEKVSDPFKQVETVLNHLPVEGWTAYGYVGFDIARFYSGYSKAIEQPMLYFFVPEIELRITNKGVHIRSINSPNKLLEAISTKTEPPEYQTTPPTIQPGDNQAYETRVADLVSAIQQGELHKAIISRSVEVKGNLDVLGTYTLGAASNNSARSYCFKLGDVRSVGFSPEILMEVNATGFVMTNPLAGTRHREADPSKDALLHDELFTDAKEVKEHALSVWLAQDEITQVCQPETVQVFDFMEVKKYRTVQHLSSRVGGQLKTDKSLWDALKVLFPGITVSGINKKLALEWIDRLEDKPRGIYAGGIGWVDSDGTADIAIAIRSAYQYGDSVQLNAGAGIVGESVPEREYMESVNKMNTMLSNIVLESKE
jgi:salicylate synthetase